MNKTVKKSIGLAMGIAGGIIMAPVIVAAIAAVFYLAFVLFSAMGDWLSGKEDEPVPQIIMQSPSHDYNAHGFVKGEITEVKEKDGSVTVYF